MAWMRTEGPPLAASLVSARDLAVALGETAELGFTHVELAALCERPADHLEALADAGVLVGCALLGPSSALCADDPGARRLALRQLQEQIADAARLGAPCAYLSAGAGGRAAYFAESANMLAEYAAGRMVRLGIAPSAAGPLPDVPAVLAWLALDHHPNLGLAAEGIAPDEVRQAGPRLFHVRLTEAAGPALRTALAAVAYRGCVTVPLA